MATIKIKDRKTKKIIEIKEDKTTLFLYNTLVGRVILKIITLKIISKIVGFYLNSKLSRKIIPNFIKKNKIDMTDYEEVNYKSFNDFFARNIKKEARVLDQNKKVLISPCDAKLSVYNITDNSEFIIKGSPYKIKDLLNSDLANDYLNGYICIFRLCVDDYHRYAYIDDGYKSKNTYINGVLHTVRPIALNRYNIYHQNAREWTILHTKNFDDVIQVEVGALMVGKIVNLHQNHTFKKGEEKGYFEFGGSTICLLFKDKTIKIDEDILKNTKNEIETIVKLGEKIGKKR